MTIQLNDGDTVRLVSGQVHQFECVGCGLTHHFSLQVDDANHILWTLLADPPSKEGTDDVRT